MSAFGSITSLTAGTATLAKTAGQQFFYVQNNAVTPLTLSFKDAASATLGQIVLNPAGVAGNAGDYLDSVSFPMFLDAVSVVLTGTGTGQFSSGASSRPPTYIVGTANAAPTRGG